MKSLEIFKQSLEKFPESSDLHNYYGEVLTETQQFDEALKHFELGYFFFFFFFFLMFFFFFKVTGSSITIYLFSFLFLIVAHEKNPTNPLSLINKSFLIHRWKDDVSQAQELLKKAIEIDPHCELAHAHLGQLYIQQSKLSEAIESYEKGLTFLFIYLFIYFLLLPFLLLSMLYPAGEERKRSEQEKKKNKKNPKRIPKESQKNPKRIAKE